MDIVKRLLNAIANNEILEIIYHGGSTPGKARKITPSKLENNKLRAYCHNSSVVKLFNINKISFFDNLEYYNADPDEVFLNNPINSNNLQNIFAYYENEFCSLGWFPFFDKDENSIKLFTKYKNGNFRKSADLLVFFNEYLTDSYYDPHSDEMVEGKRLNLKPWCVSFVGGHSSYSKLTKAFKILLNSARENAPNNNT